MTAPDFPPLDATAPPAAVLARIEAAGIVGMGGGGFPTAAKLRIALAQGVDMVIGNGLATEPGTTADIALLQAHLEEVAAGLELVRRCLSSADGEHAVQAVLAVPPNSGIGPPAIAVDAPYPAGHERQLVAHIAGRAVPNDKRPTDVGVVVLNVATLFAINDAVRHGKALRRRLVTVGDTNHWLALGTPLATLKPLLAQDASRANSTLRVRGPLTGHTASTDAVVDATTFHLDWAPMAAPCIGCGWCRPACPEHLAPDALHAAFERNAEDATAQDCTECGACSAACPSSIDLVNEFRALKMYHQREAARRRSAETARHRFDARTKRLRQTANAKDQRRDARLRRRHTW